MWRIIIYLVYHRFFPRVPSISTRTEPKSTIANLTLGLTPTIGDKRGEEIERLLTTGTIKPILFCGIPTNKVMTYVNPICVEKMNDDGSLKLRTRLTIGGDRIVYPYETTAVTAEMNALKILLNCMISEDARWTTIDLTDFYLGTDLPHPEFIRIPGRLIPPEV